MITPLEIKDQLRTDICTGCVISSIAEEYVGEPCEEAYSFAAGRKASPIKRKYGVPARFALWGAIKYGVLPKSKSPYSLASQSRDFLEKYENWEPLMKDVIYPFGSARKIRGFDAIAKATEETSVFMGLYWQSGWTEDPYIEKFTYEFSKMEPHEVRVIGYLNDHLIIQNSKGPNKGDNGLWYMSRNVAKAIDHAYILSPEKKSCIVNLLETI